eukprot:344102-Rhodomonas_salina.1
MAAMSAYMKAGHGINGSAGNKYGGVPVVEDQELFETALLVGSCRAVSEEYDATRPKRGMILLAHEGYATRNSYWKSSATAPLRLGTYDSVRAQRHSGSLPGGADMHAPLEPACARWVRSLPRCLLVPRYPLVRVKMHVDAEMGENVCTSCQVDAPGEVSQVCSVMWAQTRWALACADVRTCKVISMHPSPPEREIGHESGKSEASNRNP